MRRSLLIISGILVTITFFALIFVTVFKVSDINVTYSFYREEDYAVCEELLSNYKGKNLVFLDENEIVENITKNTNLKVGSIKKQYPFTLTLSLYADEERFAVSYLDGYYILDSNYVVVESRNTLINSADNLSDVLIVFDTELEPTLLDKQPLMFEDSLMLDSLKTAISLFDSPRDSLSSVILQDTEEAGNFRIKLCLRSGVEMIIFKAGEDTREKVLAGIAKYKGLSDGDLVNGSIECFTLDSGSVTAVYTRA